MSQNDSMQGCSSSKVAPNLPPRNELAEAAKTHVFHFRNLQDAKDGTLPQVELNYRALVLDILRSFETKIFGEIPLDKDQSLKQVWNEWQAGWRKRVQDIVDDANHLHQVERVAWLYIRELLALHQKGYKLKPGIVVDTTLTFAARVNCSSRLLERYPQVAHQVLLNQDGALEKFAADPRKYTDAVVGEYLNMVAAISAHETARAGVDRRRAQHARVAAHASACMEALKAEYGPNVVSSNSKSGAAQKSAQVDREEDEVR